MDGCIAHVHRIPRSLWTTFVPARLLGVGGSGKSTSCSRRLPFCCCCRSNSSSRDATCMKRCVSKTQGLTFLLFSFTRRLFDIKYLRTRKKIFYLSYHCSSLLLFFSSPRGRNFDLYNHILFYFCQENHEHDCT